MSGGGNFSNQDFGNFMNMNMDKDLVIWACKGEEMVLGLVISVSQEQKTYSMKCLVKISMNINKITIDNKGKIMDNIQVEIITISASKECKTHLVIIL